MGIPLHYGAFQAGMDTKDSPYLLDEGLGPLPSRDLSNVVGTLAGAITKRNGLVTFASPASTPSSLFPFEAVSPIQLIAAVGTTLVAITTGGATSTIKTGLTNNARWEFVSAPVVGGQGPLFGMNGGADTPQRWDGVAATTSNWTNASGAVAVPNGKYLIYAANQVFVTGVAATPSRVFWSAIGDPSNWDPASLTGAGSADLDPGDGQAITGIGRVGNYILVAKPRKLWVISDTAGPTIRRITDQVGCVAHRSIQSGSEGTYFLSEDRGVYLTNGSSLKPISDKIQPTIDLVGSQKSNAVGVYYNGHYLLAVAGSGSGSNDTTLDWDATLQSWWRHSFGSNQFAVWHPTTTAQLYSAKSTAAIVDQCLVSGVFTDNGTPFQWVWRGPWQSPSFYRRRLFPTPYYRKRLRQVRYDGSGTVNFSLAKDFAIVESLIATDVFNAAATSTTWGGSGSWADTTLTWAGNPGISRGRSNSLGVANAFSVVFSATSNTADTVDSYTLMMADRKDGVVA